MKKMLTWLLCLCMILSLVPAAVIASEVSAETTYYYAYDVQRSPAFPASKGAQISLRSFNLPLMRGDGETSTSEDRYDYNAGEWTLAEVGIYGEKDSFDPVPSKWLDGVANSVANNYDLSVEGKNSLVVHKMTDKDGNLVGYGLVIAVDETNGYALFVADLWNSSGAGYLLSMNEITESSVILNTEQMVQSTYAVELSTNEIIFEDGVYDAEEITVTNTGDTATGDLTVTLSGGENSAFELSTDRIESIENPGDVATFTIAPRLGMENGRYSETITVNGEHIVPQSIAVSFCIPSTTYSIYFDKNGGEGSNHRIEVEAGSVVTIPYCGNYRDGYTFVGWSDTPDGEVKYLPLDTVIDLAEIGESATLYAIWEKNAGEEVEYKEYLIDTENPEEIKTILDGVAEVTVDETTGEVNIKLISDVKGRITFNWIEKDFVIDMNGKTIDPGELNEALCLDNSYWGEVTITGDGVLKKGRNNVIYTGLGNLYFDVAEGMDYFTLKNGEENIFEEKNATAKEYFWGFSSEYDEFVLKQWIEETAYVAVIGEAKFETLGAAVAAAQAGDTITLIDDVALTEKLVIDADDEITLNLGGKTLTTFAVNSNYDIVVKGDLTIEGEGNVVVSGVYGIGVTGNLTVNGGNFSDVEATYYIIGSFGETTINGGSFDTHYIAVNGFQGEGVEVKGGSFKSADAYYVIAGDVEVTDGTFDRDVTYYCAYGFKTEANAEGVYGVVEANYVADVDGYGYESFADALADAEDGSVITLLADVTVDEIVKLEKAVTLDLDGHAINSTAKKAIEVYADATIKNGTVTGSERAVDTRKAVTLNLENVTLNTTAKAVNTQPLTIGGSENGTVVNVKDSTIDAGKIGYGIITFVESDINVVNTEINGYAALYFKEGSAGTTADVDAASVINANGIAGERFGAIVTEETDITVTVAGTINMEEVADAENMAILFKGDATDNKIALNGAVNGTVIDEYIEGTTITTTNVAVAEAIEAAGFEVEEENGVYTVVGEVCKTYKVMFVSGEMGYFNNRTDGKTNRDAVVFEGVPGTAVETPSIRAEYGYAFIGWDAEEIVTAVGTENIVYRAQYEKTAVELPFKDIVTLRADDVIYRPAANTIQIYMDRALVRQASGSLGVAIVPNDGETIEYVVGNAPFTKTNTSKYTSFVSGVNTEAAGGGEHGTVDMKIFKKATGTRQETKVNITNAEGEVTEYTIRIIFNDNVYEGDVDVTEILPLRAIEDSFVIDNDAKTIYYETTSNYTSTGFAVATATGITTKAERPRRQLTAKSGQNLAHGEITAGGALADKFDRYVVARQSKGLEQTYQIKVHGGEDGLEYSWYTVTVKFNRLFEGDIEFADMKLLNADSYEFDAETNTVNITYSSDVVAFAPVLIDGVKAQYKMPDGNGEYINKVNEVTETIVDGTAGYAFKAENGANQTFVLRLKVNTEYTEYTFNLNYVG